VGCGVCDTPELWCGAAGLWLRVYARVLVPPNLYIHTYIPPPHIVLFTHYDVSRIFEVYIVPYVQMIRRVYELGAASTVQAIYQAVSYPSFFICNVCWLCPLRVLTVGSLSACPMSSPIYTTRLSPLA